MSEDKTKQDEPVEEKHEDDEPDVEAHNMRARRSMSPEDAPQDPGMRAKRPNR